MSSHVLSYGIIVLLIAFSVYRRIRRNIGWQVLIPRRLYARAFIFIIIGLLLLGVGAVHPVSLISDIIGIVVGASLAYYGIRLTQFEWRESHWYFQPNTWIGGTVIVLFLGRLSYRFYSMYALGIFNSQGTSVATTSSSQMNQMSSFSGASWTAGLLLIMFAYYVLYYFLLLHKEKTLKASEKIS